MEEERRTSNDNSNTSHLFTASMGWHSIKCSSCNQRPL